MMNSEDLTYMVNRLDDARHEITCCAETLVGRDTYPIIDDTINTPFAFYVAIEIERIVGAITQLQSNVRLSAEEARDIENYNEAQEAAADDHL